MKIEFLVLEENEDGSANAQVDLDAEAKSFLIQLGFETLLLKYIEQEKTNFDT